MSKRNLLGFRFVCGVCAVFSLAALAAGADEYDLRFDVPRHGYKVVDNSAFAPREIVGKIKFFEDASHNAFTIMDNSVDFTSELQLRDAFAKKAKRVKDQGYEAKWEKKGPYQVLCVSKKSRDRYIYEYMFATGKHGYYVTMLTPDEHGLALELGHDVLTIVDNVRRPPLTDRLAAIKCDICLAAQRKGGYVIDHKTVVGSDAYINWYIDHHKKQGNLPNDLVVTSQAKQLIRSSLDQAAGATPWFICDASMVEIFPDVLKDKKRAMHYRQMAQRFWAKINVSNEMAEYKGGH